ncbi:hypothetical protein T4E_5095 [Trichinella pseudospiralis]|uniref:Uncharacterized protein n=1 Tax=Trichinella pseudospiralis TaxID=6337 RepID=A0A0V0YNS1_TRIPS|nr:hypothetical protein T4E_5095 [Trichinella pseudospiralis]
MHILKKCIILATVALLQCNGEDSSTESSYLKNRAGEVLFRVSQKELSGLFKIVTKVTLVSRNSTVTTFQASVADSDCRVAGSSFSSYETMAEKCQPTSEPVKCTISYFFGNLLVSDVKCENRVVLVTLKKEQQLGKSVQYDSTDSKVIQKAEEALFDFDQKKKSKKYRKLVTVNEASTRGILTTFEVTLEVTACKTKSHSFTSYKSMLEKCDGTGIMLECTVQYKYYDTKTSEVIC